LTWIFITRETSVRQHVTFKSGIDVHGGRED